MRECVICNKKQKDIICKACVGKVGNDFGKFAKKVKDLAPIIIMPIILNRIKKK